MESPVTLRLDTETREKLARIAEQKRISASEAIREAIDAWIDRYEASVRPFDQASDLIGVVRGGDKKRSAQTGRRLTEMLKGRKNRS